MKLETLFLLLKGFFFLMLGVCTAAGGVLATWKEKQIKPDFMDWGILLCAIGMGVASNGLAFLSSSVSNYLNEKKANGGTQMWSRKPSP